MKLIVNLKLYLILLALSGLVSLLFFAESNLFPSRSWQYAWNLGHIPLFIMVGYAVFHFFCVIHEKSLLNQVLLLASIAFFSGAFIEYLQTFVGRQASLQDVMLDVTGSVISVALFSNRIRMLSFRKKAFTAFLVISLILFVSWKLMSSLWDEYQARSDFPVLADFEHAREINRWTSIEKIEISDEVSKLGLKSLKLTLTPRTYSGVELQYFPGDWSGYRRFGLHVFYSEAGPIFLTVSIFDNKHHANRYSFTDRYTKSFQLQPGWNAVNISLDDVKHAPQKREMDMTRIRGLRLFVVRPGKMQHIYIDGVRLEN